MRRRDKAGGKTVRRRFKASKRQNGLKARNRDETLEQLAATSEVLEAISHSTFDLQTVLATLVKSAGRLCQAENVQIFLYDGEFYRLAADNGFSPEYQQHARDHPIRPGRDTLVARTALGIEPVQIRDALADPEYTYGGQKLGGYRTLLGVPLLRDKKCIGVIALTRSKVHPFTDRQIALVTNFAAQAVIAIENTRLLNELRESLQQQTATADVLKVISSSPGELEPVFDAMLANATRICEATIGTMYLYEGTQFRGVALHHSKQSYVDYWRRNSVIELKKHSGTPLDRLANTKRVVHIPDLRSDQSYLEKRGRIVALVEDAGVRTFVSVPMIKEGELVGAINLYRQEVRPFTDKQINLVENFASQAVIAIENARLLNELRQRTDDLSESLERQTATSEVLRVISSSAGELEPVFQTLLGNATRLCMADFGFMFQYKDGFFQLMGQRGADPTYVEYMQREPLRPGPETLLGRIATSISPVQIADFASSQAYLDRDPLAVVAVERGGVRTLFGVPMLREGELIGAIALYRQEVSPFTEKQIDLLTNFAAQAVVAIENTRLLNELRQRTHELATSLDHLRSTQDRLVQTQKLASLGQLTAGIAHEIKNPLNFVNNFSGVSAELIDELQEALTDVSLNEKRRSEITELMDTLRGNLDKIVQHGKRADAIVKNMLLHSREGLGEHRLVDINAIVEESLNLAYHGARAEKQGFNITLQRSLDSMAGEADVFPQDITRALLNLISNGFYAATKRKAEANGGDYEPTLAATTKNLGDRVEIRIRDNGTGIPTEVRERLFTPFFTTKPAGEGTGLGLSISHDIIVKQHGGSIEVDTQPGEFTEIRIILPRAVASLPGGRA